MNETVELPLVTKNSANAVVIIPPIHISEKRGPWLKTICRRPLKERIKFAWGIIMAKWR